MYAFEYAFVTTACRVLKFHTEEQPPDMEGTCEYIK
jgi:hypothetical protein